MALLSHCKWFLRLINKMQTITSANVNYALTVILFTHCKANVCPLFWLVRRMSGLIISTSLHDSLSLRKPKTSNMKKQFYILVLLLFTHLIVNAQNTNPTDFTLYSVSDSSKFVLSENKGKYVVLHFLLKTECPYCMRLTMEYAINADSLPDVVQVFIKPDAKEELDKWTAKVPDKALAKFAIYHDPNAALAKKFKIKGGYDFHNESVNYPALIIIDPSGKEVFRYIGTSNSDRYSFAQLKAKMKELKAIK